METLIIFVTHHLFVLVLGLLEDAVADLLLDAQQLRVGGHGRVEPELGGRRPRDRRHRLEEGRVGERQRRRVGPDDGPNFSGIVSVALR